MVLSTIGATPFKIARVKNPLRKYMSVKVATVRDGKDYQVTARLKRNIPPGVIDKEVVIYTNDPEQSQIRAPIYALVSE